MNSINKLINELYNQGIKLSVENDKIHYRAEKGILTDEILTKIKENKAEIIDYFNYKNSSEFKLDLDNRYEPFPLTDIQNSYVVGRNSLYELGGVTCHGYIEITYNTLLDHDRLSKAWNKVIKKHDMLRAIIFDGGYQQVQKEVPEINVEFYDFSSYSIEEQELKKLEIRNKYSEKEYELGKWPMCDIVLSIYNDKSIIHFSLDMLITDFTSANIILDDLDKYYNDEYVNEEVEILYRDVVIYNKKQEENKSIKRIEDEIYWKNKIKDMGIAPELLVESNTLEENFKFSQKKYFINSEEKKKMFNLSKQLKVTPSVIILSAFGETLNKWSKNSNFCINLTVLGRNKNIFNIEKVVGDFTGVNIFSMKYDKERSFKDSIVENQLNLLEDMEHDSVSGIEVLRNLGREYKENIIIPIVYTSTLGTFDKDYNSSINSRNISYRMSQTPQVWIDCQVSEENGGILVNWDYRVGVFSNELIDKMFESFTELLSKLSNNNTSLLNDTDPIGLDKHFYTVRNELNCNKKEFQSKFLYDGFLESCKLYPNKTALITNDGEYTYNSLEKHVYKILISLKEAKVESGEVVAIMLPKGVWQIAGVLAILLNGDIYLPIDMELPTNRKNDIIKNSCAKYIIADSNHILDIEDSVRIINVETIDNIEKTEANLGDIKIESKNYEQPAYIIYTSGTTGIPKGVLMSHKAAMNTIFDVIDRFGYDKNDVFLGLANLAFDLSVFDVFGSFTVGGTLVLPDDNAKNNPKYILDLLVVHGITAWNSVPAQIKMISNYIDGLEVIPNLKLKIILLSGDWIPVDLPEKLFSQIPSANVVSLGGATEAGIWSIFYEIPKNYVKKNSIPYGAPLTNQKFYILNESLGDCPPEVQGEIYIGGDSLATGYFKDSNLTNDKFIFLERENERVYKTGDIGKYDKNGIIEFLGRLDSQVKIRGHRIELSEIDAILTSREEIQDVVSIITGASIEDRKISTLVVPKLAKNIEESANELTKLTSKEKCLTNNIDKNLLVSWYDSMNKVVLSDILTTFIKNDIFIDAEITYDFNHIVNSLKVPEKLHKLLRRWLNVLNVENIITVNDKGYMLNKSVSLKYIENDALWDEMYNKESELNYSKDLLDYLKKSSNVLSELISGKEDPLNLLFPKGKVDVAMAAYHDNIINIIMNSLVKEEMEYLISNANKKLNILEVGAGVGGTTVDLVDILKDKDVEYYFTDISKFFLNNAKSKFESYKWMKYDLFDINIDVMEQSISPFSLDVIIAANVLHNSKNIHFVIENLRKLLRPNGTLIIIEETKEAYSLLTSMEFKDGLTGFTDERLEHNQTFIKSEQWEKIFSDHNANIIYEFPRGNNNLKVAGQSIFIVRFNENYSSLDKQELVKYMEIRLPEYMIPSNILSAPYVPQTSNGKIDRKAVKKWFDTHAKNDKKTAIEDLPRTTLQKQIAKIWCEELNIEEVGLKDNFYLIGGDSLLIAQVIGKIIERIDEAKTLSWDDLLREMMKNPTVEGLSNVILKSTVQNEQDKSLVKLRMVNPSDAKKAIVVFHAGTGTLTPYNSLISYIIDKAEDETSIMGFTFGDEASYLSIPVKNTFESLGKKYGEILKNMDFSEYILIGHCVGGLIALEVANVLENSSKNVSSVTLISTSIADKKEDTSLHSVEEGVFNNAVQTSLYNELLLERTFASLIGADIGKSGYKIDNQTLQSVIEYLIFNNKGDISVSSLCSLTDDFSNVREEFIRLREMDATERMNNLYNTIERPNGDLMEHQRKMLNVLYRIFAQNFRCVASYKPKACKSKLRVFECESPIANFFPSLFSEGKNTWEKYAENEFYFDTIAGDHISCMNSPYIESNISKILNL